MRFFLCVFVSFLFSPFCLFSQNGVRVFYEESIKTDFNYIENHYELVSDNEKSVFEQVEESKHKNEIKETGDNEYVIIDGNKPKMIYYIDFETNNINILSSFKGEKIKIKDQPPTLEWDILGDSKSIANYTVIKATTHFRGRDFVAWFTPEIPVKAGPWKFFGLPGLILEAYDTEKIFRWNAQLVQYPKEFSKNIFKKIEKDKINRSFDMKEALDWQMKTIEQQENIYRARAQKEFPDYKEIDSEIDYRKYAPELKYEWE